MRTSARSPFGPARCVPLALGLLMLCVSGASAQRLARSHLKSGDRVRGAFRSVVAEARRSTVRIYADDEIASLGVVVDADGWILTKASQLKGRVVCRLHDDRRLTADIVRIDPKLDIALLKVESENLPAARWSTAADPGVGRWLASVGIAELPVAVGVVSVHRREIPPQRGVLGISISDEDGSPRITQVFPESGAEQAGLKAGDIILSVSGNAVKTGSMLADLLQKHLPGEQLPLLVRRGEKEFEVEATMGLSLSKMLDRGAFQNQLGGELSVRRSGFRAALQHDTVLRPEDCGGPIVDLSGNIVGLNIARSGRTESLALPASEVLSLLKTFKLESPIETAAEEPPAIVTDSTN